MVHMFILARSNNIEYAHMAPNEVFQFLIVEMAGIFRVALCGF